MAPKFSVSEKLHSKNRGKLSCFTPFTQALPLLVAAYSSVYQELPSYGQPWVERVDGDLYNKGKKEKKCPEVTA